MPDATLSTDIAVIGAGPVGLFAVFQAGMLDMTCIVLDTLEQPGGQCAALYPEKPIYDIPGYPRITAGELIDRLRRQAAPFDPVYCLGERVTTLARTGAGGWRLGTDRGRTIEARAVMVGAGSGAFGPNRPPLAGIEGFEGKSVFYLVRAREDFRAKRIVVAGGGDAAVDWAISLAEVAVRVMVVHRRDKFRAAPQSVRELRALADRGRLELVVPYQLDSLEGAGGRLTAVNVRTLDGAVKRLPADVLLAFFGLAVSLGPIAEWGLDLDRGQIRVDQADCRTNLPGIFAVGDIATYPGKLKLILTGFSEVAMACHAIHGIVHPEKPLHFEYSTIKGVPGLD